ncbi:hypothetical protein BYT27DRAFT_6376013 [Phlegmacium glaucopus]|nr:hypothetical protein BYT27DRAFT_6376013 [Phlegmacium glaucopus]
MQHPLFLTLITLYCLSQLTIMKRIFKEIVRPKKSKYSSLTINDALGSSSEPVSNLTSQSLLEDLRVAVKKLRSDKVFFPHWVLFIHMVHHCRRHRESTESKYCSSF